MAKLNWGMIGGGEGSQIGPAHRLGAGLDAAYDFVAGALDHNPDAGRAYGQKLGLAPDRAYGDWREMLAKHRYTGISAYGFTRSVVAVRPCSPEARLAKYCK